MGALCFVAGITGITGIIGACTGDPGDPMSVDAGAPYADAALEPDAGSSAAPGEPIASFYMTYYWVTTEEEFTGAPDTDVHASAGCTVLTTVGADFFASMRLEGTGRLRDGTLLNYDGACACSTSPCFTVLGDEHPWGSGAGRRALEPFRSIAVDRDVVALGSGLYILELDGMLMPGDPPWGGYVHDGCVIAADTGGGIDGMQIDLFSGLRNYYLILDSMIDQAEISLYDGGRRCPPEQ